MIEVSNLTYGYSREKLVLNNLSASFAKGQVTSILGRNGSGKSTLLKNINNILTPRSGNIRFNGKDIKDMSAREISKTVGFLSQRSEGIDATVMDAVLTGRRPHITFNISDTDREITKKTLRLMGLHDFACRNTTEISGGELQKVVISRALVQEPQIMLLDEPVNHLDMVNQMEVLGLIRDITLDKNLTTVIVMHDINTAIRFSDKLLFIKDGEVSGQCAVNDISADLIKDVFDFDVDIIAVEGRPFVIPK